VNKVTSGAGGLLRGPDERRPTFLDLFFDLVFVFALFHLSQGLLEHLNGRGAFQTLVLLLALIPNEVSLLVQQVLNRRTR
jgi:low temperature requirement protein LtrA